jgi:EAL domain-containing protein (putative c-di-GMP-specific phosphodiesterase class I)
VSALKLDRSFVDGLGTGSRQAAVATAVVQVARALHLTRFAEGVETTEQAELLRRPRLPRHRGTSLAHPLRG